jgi:hypothetical protein
MVNIRNAQNSLPLECTDCGEPVFIAKCAVLLKDGRRARYGWQCWACGHSFRTTVRVEPTEAAIPCSSGLL